MVQAKCAHCGAALDGLVCKYCGAASSATEDLEKQKRALEEYHGLFVSRDDDALVKLLKNGFLPDHGTLLIDAGLRCVSMLDDSAVDYKVTDAAALRLEAIVMKLKLKVPDRENEKAIEMFSAKLKEHKASGNRDAIYGITAIVVIIAVTALALWLILS